MPLCVPEQANLWLLACFQKLPGTTIFFKRAMKAEQCFLFFPQSYKTTLGLSCSIQQNCSIFPLFFLKSAHCKCCTLNNEIVFVCPSTTTPPSQNTSLTDKDKANLLRNPISISINVHCANRNRVMGLGETLVPVIPRRTCSHCASSHIVSWENGLRQLPENCEPCCLSPQQ